MNHQNLFFSSLAIKLIYSKTWRWFCLTKFLMVCELQGDLSSGRRRMGLFLAHLSLLGHISGELGLDEVSDFISWEECPKSGVFWAPETLSLRAQRDRSHELYKRLKKDGQIILPNTKC